MKDIIFYMDTLIGREIAFILGIDYKFVDKINKKNAKNNTIFIEKEEDIEIAKEKHLIHIIEYVTIKDLCDYFSKFSRIESNNKTLNYEEIKTIPNQSLSLPQMLIKVLYSPPKDINCISLIYDSNIDSCGNIWGCCPGWIEIPTGNILYEDNFYDNYYARMIKLSNLNKSFCFCNLNNCSYYNSKELESYNVESFDIPKFPKYATISIDKTCNLRCNSCRTNFIVLNKEEQEIAERITNKLIESDFLNNCALTLAGDGEVFLSKNYQKIIDSLRPNEVITILSNGVLVTEEKLKKITSKFKYVNMLISVDAATKETYNKLRHGPFDKLLQNLKMLGEKRKKNEITWFVLNFVVQKDNYNELKDFIRLAQNVNADRVHLTRLNYWGSMPYNEYEEKNMIEGDHLKYELYEVLKDPIFSNDIVDMDFFKSHFENSKRYFENN